MELRVKHALLTMLACALVIFALPALADSQARIVRLSYLDGSVQIDRNTGNGFEKAITNMPITQGTRISTGDDGEAEIEFENGSTVRLAPNTELDFRQLSLKSDGGKVTMAALERGTAYLDVKSDKHDDFRLSFNGNDVQLQKSVHLRAEVEDRDLKLAVFNGEVEFRSAGRNVKVKKNETLSFNLDASENYQLAKGVATGQYDWWDKERSDYLDRYAYNEQDHIYSPMDAAYSTPYYGWSDLNYYGNFSYVPGYGYAWRPYSVGMNWDPFSAGYWVWYPTAGYTWVSPYPWGWIPYRYGGWRFIPGYGWSWLPGSWNSGWYSIPRVYGAPPAYRPPVPPQTPPSGGSVVRVGNPLPLTPRMRPRMTPPEDGLNGRPGARITPGARNAVVPQPSVKQPVGNVNVNKSRPIPPGRVSPDVTRGVTGNPQGRVEASPRVVPRPVESPRIERSAPVERAPRAPRMERPAPAPPPAPRMSAPPPSSFGPPPSMMRSAPSMGSPAVHTGGASAPRGDSSGRPPK